MEQLPPPPDDFTGFAHFSIDRPIESLQDVAELWVEFVRMSEENPGWMFILPLIEQPDGNE